MNGFSVWFRGMKVKTFRTVPIDNISVIFARYCKKHGFTEMLYSPTSLGGVAFSNRYGEVMELRN